MARALKAVGIAAAALWALWIVVAQLFLWSPLLRSMVSAHRPSVILRYDFAWSLLPGRAHVRGLVLTGRTNSFQWRLAIDRVTVDVALAHLLDRVFHARRVRASGVEFALRRTLMWWEAEPWRLRGLPPMEGFGEIPFGEYTARDVQPDWRYRSFTVWLQDVQAGVRRIWIDDTRLEGEMNLAGAWYFKPQRRNLIEPGELRGEALTLRRGEGKLLDGLSLSLRTRIGPFDPRDDWRYRVRSLDADLQVDARVVAAPPLRVRGGTLHAALRVQAGELLDGSALRLVLQEPAFRGVRAGEAVLELGDAGSPPSAARATLHVTGASGFGARVSALRASADFARDLVEPAPPLAATLDVHGAIDDAARLPGGLFDGGQGTFAVRVAGPWHRLAGEATARLDGLAGAAGDVALRGNAQVVARVSALDPLRGADLDGTRLAVDDVRVVSPGGHQDEAPGWWGAFTFPRARLRFSPQTVADADMEARCRDARPVVGLFARKENLPGFVRGLFAMEGLDARASLLARPGLLALRGLEAHGAGAAVHASWLREHGTARGAALLEVHGLAVALGIEKGKTSVHLIEPGGYFNERERDLQPAVTTPPLSARIPRPRRHAPPPAAAR